MDKSVILDLIRNPGLLNDDSLPILKELVNNLPLFPAGWMLLLKNLKKVGSPEFGSYLNRAALNIPDRRILYQYLHQDQNRPDPAKRGYQARKIDADVLPAKNFSLMHVPDESGNSGTEQSGIIEDFLKKKPAIKIHLKNDLKVEVDLSEKSLSEHDDFHTETMAEIYVKQKNYEKAIESFEKLSLKFPEKSIYFAARIEEIKRILNH